MPLQSKYLICIEISRPDGSVGKEGVVTGVAGREGVGKGGVGREGPASCVSSSMALNPDGSIGRGVVGREGEGTGEAGREGVGRGVGRVEGASSSNLHLLLQGQASTVTSLWKVQT